MFFDDYFNEDVNDVEDAIDQILPKDPDTEEGEEIIADQVEDSIRDQALECAEFFEGGEEAVREFMESPEVEAVMEAFPMMGKAAMRRTFVRLNKKDDITRRARLAAIIIAKEKKDPLFTKLALNRVKERKLRHAIFKKYGNKARKIAIISQRKHMAERKKFPLPIMKAPSASVANKAPTLSDIMNNRR